MTALEYIQAKQWEYRPGGGGYRLKLCPICGDTRWHFWMSEKGSANCKLCQYQKSFWDFQRDVGDMPVMSKQDFGKPADIQPAPKPLGADMEYHSAFGKFKPAIDYMISRGLKEGQLYRHFKFGYARRFVGGKEQDCITFPYYVGGKLMNVKFKSIENPKDYGKVEKQPSSLFNIDAIDLSKPVLITEGEIDAITAFYYGYKNVVSLPDGAASWAHVKAFYDCECEILICTDMDDPGEAAAKSIAEFLGDFRCRRVKLPHKDFNDCLKAGVTKEEIDKYIADAKYATRSDVVHIKSTIMPFLENLSNRGEAKVYTGFSHLDYLMQGVRFNEVTVLSGDSGVGKTTWATNLVFNLEKRGIPCLMISSEISNLKITGKFCGIKTGKQPYTLNNRDMQDKTPPEHWITAEDLTDATNYFVNSQFYYWGQGKPLPIESMKQYIRYVHAVLNVRFVVIDHLHHFLYHTDSKEEIRETNNFVRELTQFVESNGVHILLVCHPSKFKGKLGGHDLKGSSNIYQDAHNVWLLGRVGTDDEIDMEIWKSRDDSSQRGMVHFTYNRHNFRYICERGDQ